MLLYSPLYKLANKNMWSKVGAQGIIQGGFAPLLVTIMFVGRIRRNLGVDGSDAIDYKAWTNDLLDDLRYGCLW